MESNYYGLLSDQTKSRERKYSFFNVQLLTYVQLLSDQNQISRMKVQVASTEVRLLQKYSFPCYSFLMLQLLSDQKLISRTKLRLPKHGTV